MSTGRFSWPRASALLAAVAALTIGLASVGSAAASTAKPTAHAAASGPLFIDINGPVSDPFFQPMKVGADTAAKTFGANYVYESASNYDNLVPDYTKLVKEAITRKPAGMVVWDCCGTALNPYISQAEKAGIPVIVVSSGESDYLKAGAMGFVGEDHHNTGEIAGKAAAATGVKNLLCVNNAASNPDLQSRCDGAEAAMKKAGGTSTQLILPATDVNTPAATVQAIQGYLRSHPQINGVWTQNPSIGDNTVQAVKNLGKTGKIKVSTLGLTNNVLSEIKAGTLTGATDPQQFLQGFYSLQALIQYAKYKLFPTEPILPGSIEITKGNVASVMAIQKQYSGVRGGQ